MCRAVIKAKKMYVIRANVILIYRLEPTNIIVRMRYDVDVECYCRGDDREQQQHSAHGHETQMTVLAPADDFRQLKVDFLFCREQQRVFICLSQFNILYHLHSQPL